MKSTDVIRRDHRAAEELFTQYKDASEEKKQELSKEIFNALAAHEKMEDTYFYPVVVEVASEDDKIAFEELGSEQAELEAETQTVQAIDTFSEQDTAIQELMEKVLTHAQKEENVLLARADELLSDEKQEELGAQMEPESAVAQSKG